MKEKTGQSIEVKSSATDKSPDDLEVDNILSHSKVEQQTSEHRANSIVSRSIIIDSQLTKQINYCS